jgi:hypothetical protein
MIVPTAVAIPTAMNTPEEIDSLLPDVVGAVPGVFENAPFVSKYTGETHPPDSTEDDAGVHRKTNTDGERTA